MESHPERMPLAVSYTSIGRLNTARTLPVFQIPRAHHYVFMHLDYSWTVQSGSSFRENHFHYSCR